MEGLDGIDWKVWMVRIRRYGWYEKKGSDGMDRKVWMVWIRRYGWYE